MNKILLILKREYLTRVRKKSFIIMSVLGPVLMASMIIIPVLLMTMENEDEKIIAVVDNYNEFSTLLDTTKAIKFDFFTDIPSDSVQEKFSNSKYYAVLYRTDTIPYSPNGIHLSSDIQPSIDVKMHISKSLEESYEKRNLQNHGIDKQLIESLKPEVTITTTKWDEDGGEKLSATEVIMIVGYMAALFIYIFVLMYGSQVMRGVIEEKTNRIVEIIISSVKPFQLMMGKITGVALVAITQFALWVILTTTILTTLQLTLLPEMDIVSSDPMIAQSQIQENVSGKDQLITDIIISLANLPIGALLISFLFYFLSGYLLYSSLFASIGAAVDNETDTQQFMLPITIPLIAAFLVAQPVTQNPEGAVAFWFSMIPFTSPVIMMVRIPFGVPLWELLLSGAILIASFIATTWLAGKIYRTGILMYGKKVNYKEIWKWIKYSS